VERGSAPADATWKMGQPTNDEASYTMIPYHLSVQMLMHGSNSSMKL